MSRLKPSLWITAVSLVITSTVVSAEPPSLPIKIAGLEGWVAIPVPQDELLQRFTDHAELVVTPRDKTSDQSPNILMHSKSQSEPLKTREDYRKALLNELDQKISVLNESLIERNGQKRYLIEFQSYVGTESMLNTIIMAEVFGDRIYVFNYENYHNPYQQNIRGIRKALQDLVIKPAP